MTVIDLSQKYYWTYEIKVMDNMKCYRSRSCTMMTRSWRPIWIMGGVGCVGSHPGLNRRQLVGDHQPMKSSTGLVNNHAAIVLSGKFLAVLSHGWGGSCCMVSSFATGHQLFLVSPVGLLKSPTRTVGWGSTGNGFVLYHLSLGGL